jgi:hypothetical protein
MSPEPRAGTGRARCFLRKSDVSPAWSDCITDDYKFRLDRRVSRAQELLASLDYQRTIRLEGRFLQGLAS